MNNSKMLSSESKIKINNQNIGIGINNPIKKVGIDAGLKSSNGKKIESPKFFRKSEDKLAWEQRKLSRKKKC